MHASSSPVFRRPLLRASAGALIALGVLLTLLAIFADPLGIGGGKGFGYQQLIALIAGIVFILGGLAIAFQRFLSSSSHDSFEVER